ncbi:MAG: acyltransferase [Candidatus Parcubacteria bacterium]|nr:acyltransferase [Candidatus Parcubacteria bacterium]
MEFVNVLIIALIIIPLPWLRNLYFAENCPINEKIIKQRMVFFDWLKGLAIIAVILIHVAYFFHDHPYMDNNLTFIIFFNNLARFAIPVFLICSGLLLNPIKGEKEYIDFYRRKLWRNFLPYILCTIVFALFLRLNVTDFFASLISGKIAPPYYFIIVLLELYLIYPVLDIFIRSKYFLPITFFISLVSGFFIELQFFGGIPTLLPYLFFFCYGLRCREKFLNYQKNKEELALWLAIVIFYLIFTLIMPIWYYNVRLFYGLAIFNLLFYFKDKIFKENWIGKIFIAFGKNSLWIYLIHFTIMSVIYYYCSLLNINYYLNFALVFLFTIIVSFFLAKLIQLIYDYTLIKVLKFNIKR